MKTEQEKEQEYYPTHPTHGIFIAPFLVGFFGGLVTLYPEPTAKWGWVLLTILIISGIWSIYGFFRTLDVRPKWRMVYTIAHFDLFSFYGAVFLWRETNETLWAGLLLGSLMVIAAIIGHRFRRVVFRELVAPQSGCGKLLAIVGIVGGGIAGVIGFTLGRIFNITTMGLILFPLCLLLIVIAHSFWAKAEDPGWEPGMED